jgi:hypothetical protein
MKLKSFWERHRSQRWALTNAVPLPAKARMPNPFQPLTHDQSIAVLEDAIQWLIDETRTMYAMPDGPAKLRRRAELRGRDRSMARDFARLAREQEG